MKRFLLPAFAALLALQLTARDFSYAYEGQSLVYTVTDEATKTCMVKSGAPLSAATDETKGEPTGLYLRGDMNDWQATEEWEFRTTDTPDEYVITNCTIGGSANLRLTDFDWNINYGFLKNMAVHFDEPYMLYDDSGTYNIVMSSNFTGDVHLSRRPAGWSYEYTILFVPETSKIIKGSLIIPAAASDGTNDYKVTKIEENAFSGYTGMTSVTLPNTVVSIGNQTFEGCSALNNIVLSNSLEEIGDIAFYGCNSLTEINIPASVKRMGGYLFNSCRGLEAINVDASNPWFSSIDGLLINKETNVLIKCPEGKKGDLTLPSSITGLKPFSMDSCNELTSVIIPNSVKEIPAAFMQSCEKLQTVSLPASLEKIGVYPFMYCQALYEIKVEEGCKNYSSLDGVLFSNIDNILTLVRFPQNKARVNCLGGKYEIPEGVICIGESAFQNSSVNYINIPATVTAIENYAFMECDYLFSVIIPPSVETIGDGAFYWNGQLESVTIPGSVKTIGEAAFSACNRLENVYYNTAAPVSYNQPNASYYFKGVTLFIRPEGVEAAKASAPWSSFGDIVSYDFDNINNKDYYLVGSFNNWTNSMAEYKFTPVGDGNFEFDFEGLLVDFKITDGTWDTTGTYGSDKYNFPIGQGVLTKTLVQPGNNLNFGSMSGVRNARLVFNPSEKTLSVTGEYVDLTYTYEIWGNFSDGGSKWDSIEMRNENNDGQWIAENVVAENECQFVLRQIREDNVILYWLHSADGALITEPGTYTVGWQDYNFYIAPGTWNLMYNERNGMLTVSTGSGSVDGIEVDDNVAPVYYNLQGVRVNNPANGLYIVVRGNKTTKEYIK